MMLVELQSSRCFIVNVLLVFVKVTVSSLSSMCEQVLQWRRELHLYDPRGTLVASPALLYNIYNQHLIQIIVVFYFASYCGVPAF